MKMSKWKIMEKQALINVSNFGLSKISLKLRHLGDYFIKVLVVQLMAVVK